MTGSATLPMNVSNIGFLLNRLGQDCHPLQFLRELTQNSIEAVGRSGEPGEIIWDVDWTSYELAEQPVFKLCVVDTGDGMTGQEMVKYINHLSSSLAKQTLDGNYGVGAKIAAATRNRAGLIYLSWKNGQCSMIHLWYDPETSEYGLKQFRRPDGNYDHYCEVEDSVKPPAIKEHGTMVVLFGNTEEEDTMVAPSGAPSPSRWIGRYLNTRYFRFPEGITVKSRIGWTVPRSNRDSNILSTVTGQEAYLKAHAEASGTVKLRAAIAHWWILRDEDAISQNSGYIASGGHIAAMYKDELYEMKVSGRGRTALLQNFGVVFGYARVVIYVEPASDEANLVTSNTARTALMINQEPVPWDDWAAEFRESMPVEITNLIENSAPSNLDQNSSKSIRDRLKQLLDLYNISRYRPSVNGREKIDDGLLTRGGSPGKNGSSPTGEGGTRSGERGGTAGGVYSAFLKPDGQNGSAVKADPFPQVDWISIADGSRTTGDLEDRAARFLQDQNRLLINADFRVFTDMVKRMEKEFGESPAAKDTIVKTVKAWFEQSLVEVVIGARSLEHSKEWPVDALGRALSDEALTAVVLPRYHVYYNVKRELGAKLGKATTTNQAQEVL